jgi:hypothetical protein
MIRRIGFCCKYLTDESEFGGMKVNAKNRDLNGRSTTMRWLREHPNDAEQRQWDIMNHNAAAAKRMVERVGSLPPERRMVRLGSEMLQGSLCENICSGGRSGQTFGCEDKFPSRTVLLPF